MVKGEHPVLLARYQTVCFCEPFLALYLAPQGSMRAPKHLRHKRNACEVLKSGCTSRCRVRRNTAMFCLGC